MQKFILTLNPFCLTICFQRKSLVDLYVQSTKWLFQGPGPNYVDTPYGTEDLLYETF